MKFLSLALGGAAAAAPTLAQAEIVVHKYDANGDGCLEFNEFWHVMQAKAAAQGQPLPPQMRGLVQFAFQQKAGPDQCLQPAEIAQ